MVTKSKKQTTVEKEQQRGRVKVGKLKLNKETVEELTAHEADKIKGGGTTGCGTGTALTSTCPNRGATCP